MCSSSWACWCGTCRSRCSLAEDRGQHSDRVRDGRVALTTGGESDLDRFSDDPQPRATSGRRGSRQRGQRVAPRLRRVGSGSSPANIIRASSSGWPTATTRYTGGFRPDLIGTDLTAAGRPRYLRRRPEDRGSTGTPCGCVGSCIAVALAERASVVIAAATRRWRGVQALLGAGLAPDPPPPDHR